MCASSLLLILFSLQAESKTSAEREIGQGKVRDLRRRHYVVTTRVKY